MIPSQNINWLSGQNWILDIYNSISSIANKTVVDINIEDLLMSTINIFTSDNWIADIKN